MNHCRHRIPISCVFFTLVLLILGADTALTETEELARGTSLSQTQRHIKEGHLHHHFTQAMIAHDFANYSCQSIYQHIGNFLVEKNSSSITAATSNDLQCAYARTCNDGDGILFAERVFCQQENNDNSSSSTSSPTQQFLILAAPLGMVLIVMFRILGSTAEEFFSPGLEMMSLELGLPERFAGVTLLALGNGAPDVASTVNAILNDRKTGYLMALGELTGAAMVASTVIVGAVTFVSPAAEGIACRGPLIRDVVMFIATNIVVFSAFADGSISMYEIHFLLVLYVVYVLVVLVADLYHKRHEISFSLRSAWNKLDVEGGTTTATTITAASQQNETVGLLHKGRGRKVRRPSYEAIVEAFSNYDNRGQTSNGTQRRDDEGESGRSNGQDSTASSDEPLMVFHPHHGGMVDLKQSERFQRPSQAPESWKQAWVLAWIELQEHSVKLWKETYENDQYNFVEKILMTCELPFMILRMVRRMESKSTRCIA
jgi:sodium/potassium/calcium exchanger 6